jgi:hypothetical protein
MNQSAFREHMNRLKEEKAKAFYFSHWLTKSKAKPDLNTAQKMTIFKFVIACANSKYITPENSIINEIS